MPKVNGRKLEEIVKSDPKLSGIPIVALSTSDHEQDIARCYRVGVNSYVSKPTDFDQFVAAISTIEHYWLRLVKPVPQP